MADVERTTAAPKRRAFTVHVNRQIKANDDRKAQVGRDAAAYDQTSSARPLKPPTLPANMPKLRSPGSRGLDQTKLKAPPIFWTGEGWRF